MGLPFSLGNIQNSEKEETPCGSPSSLGNKHISKKGPYLFFFYFSSSFFLFFFVFFPLLFLFVFFSFSPFFIFSFVRLINYVLDLDADSLDYKVKDVR